MITKNLNRNTNASMFDVTDSDGLLPNGGKTDMFTPVSINNCLPGYLS